MAIDNFGPAIIDPEDQKKWETLRTQAFFKAVAGKLGGLTESNILDAYDGNINAAVDDLGIDDAFKAAVHEAIENERVNQAMDQADRLDGGCYSDFDIVIGRGGGCKFL